VEGARDAIHHHPERRFRAAGAFHDPKGLENEGVFQHLKLRGNEGLAFVPHNVRHVALRESVGLGFIQARFDDITGWNADALELEGIRRGAYSCSRIDETRDLEPTLTEQLRYQVRSSVVTIR